MPKHRLFVAIWPPAEVVAAIDAALPRDMDTLRWQPPSRWHVTLAFLGDRSPAKELRRFDRLELLVASEVQVAGSGNFGQILWLGVRSGPWLAHVAARVQTSFDAPDRRFRAHLTVARARSREAGRELTVAQQRLREFVSVPWVPTEITLVASALGPAPTYEVIGRRPFQGP